MMNTKAANLSGAGGEPKCRRYGTDFFLKSGMLETYHIVKIHSNPDLKIGCPEWSFRVYPQSFKRSNCAMSHKNFAVNAAS
jgi:hypothetical protein